MRDERACLSSFLIPETERICYHAWVDIASECHGPRGPLRLRPQSESRHQPGPGAGGHPPDASATPPRERRLIDAWQEYLARQDRADNDEEDAPAAGGG